MSRTLDAQKTEELLQILYKGNYYLFNEIEGDGEGLEMAKSLNVDALELITDGAYKAPDGYGFDPDEQGDDDIAEELSISQKLAKNYKVPKWLVSGNDFPIVGRRFTPAEFAYYLQNPGESFKWSPSGVTAHHTAFPSLAMRPDGFTEQHMRNLRSYYRNSMRWRSGPQIFTDDHGIWVLTPVTRRGVHARSFNSTHIGIEMLGNFDDAKEFNSERGKKSVYYGQVAAALIMKHLNIRTGRLNFHRDDKRTSKSCPGRQVDFPKFRDAVLDIYENLD